MTISAFSFCKGFYSCNCLVWTSQLGLDCFGPQQVAMGCPAAFYLSFDFGTVQLCEKYTSQTTNFVLVFVFVFAHNRLPWIDQLLSISA